MRTYIYHCANEVARGQVLQELLDFSEKQITRLFISRVRNGFDVRCDQVTDDIHKNIVSRVSGIEWEEVA